MRNTRNVTVKTLTLGTPETILLPRNYCHRYLILRLSGTVDIVAGTSAMTASVQGGSNLLSNIRIRRDGKDTLYAVDGKLTYEMNKLMYGVAPQQTMPAVTNATNTAVKQTLIVPFENIGGMKPFDTLLKGAGLSSLDLLIDTQSAQNIMVGGNGTVTVNSAFTLEVSTVEEVGVNNFIFGDIRQYIAQKIPVTGASSSFQIKPISVGNYYKGFLLYVEDTGAGSDSVVTNIKLKSGTEVFFDRPAQAIKDEMKARLNQASPSTGAYYLDFMSDGSLNQTLDVTNNSGRETLEFELVTAAPSGTCNIYIVPLEYVPPVVVKKG